ncbi:MAG: periplasmic cell division protein (SufI) [Acidimicrobiia bacterium]
MISAMTTWPLPLTRRDALRLLGTSAAAGLLPLRLPRQADVELTLRAAPGSVPLFAGAQTQVWRYTGTLQRGPAGTLTTDPNSYLGPTLRFRRGQRVRITFVNDLPEASIVHWHGLDVPEAADGHPHLAIEPGRQYVYEFEVINRAGTYWYHPHPHGRTGAQVARGLAGLLIVEDDEEARLRLPSGDAELCCVVQDRRLDGGNQFTYLGPGMMDRMHGFLGDRFLVNGRPTPTHNVATQAHRLRLLNGSSSRVYKLGWSDGTPLTVIGTDGGLLERPRTMRHLTLAPAQRADLIIDLSGREVGSSVHLQAVGFPQSDVDPTMGMMGGPSAADAVLMTLKVERRVSVPFALPDVLSKYDASWTAEPGAPVRELPITFRQAQWFLDGRTFDMHETTPGETVKAGSTHIWNVMNVGGMMGTPMAHPFHMHGRQFRILSRTPLTGATPGSESVREGLLDDGWHDTVLILPNEQVRLQIRFSDYPGLFLYHCHLLEHEDMGMMRNFRIVPR